jgi:hypothetical protein
VVVGGVGFKPDTQASFWDVFLFQAFFIRKMQVLYALELQMLKTILWGGENLEDWKIKISVLWLFYIVAFLAVMTLGIMEPGVLNQFLETGEIGGMKIGQELLLFFAVMMLVPLGMAFLSLTLKDSTNRWANVIVGIVYVGFQLFALAETLTLSTVYGYAVLMEAAKVVVPALIVWYAWKSRQKA